MRSLPPIVKPTRTSLHRERARLLRALADIDEQLATIDVDPTASEYSSLRPAPDATPDSHNRACRQGRVQGARKVGRVWICSAEAWNARKPAPAPKLKSASSLDSADAALLGEFGARRAS